MELELIPKPAYFRNEREVAFYGKYFQDIVWRSVEDVQAVSKPARQEAEKSGLGAMDALHLAAASLGEADEFITLEKRGSPIYRTSLVRIVYLSPAAA